MKIKNILKLNDKEEDTETVTLEILKPAPERRTLGVSLYELNVVLDMIGCWRLAHELYYHQGLGLSFFNTDRNFENEEALLTAWENVKKRISVEIMILKILRQRAHPFKTFIDDLIEAAKLFEDKGYEVAAIEQ